MERSYLAEIGFTRSWLREAFAERADLYDEEVNPRVVAFVTEATDNELDDLANEILDYLYQLADQSYSDIAYDFIAARVGC